MDASESREALLEQLEAARAKVRDLDARIAANLAREQRMLARLVAAECLHGKAAIALGGLRHLQAALHHALMNVTFTREQLERHEQAAPDLRRALDAPLSDAATTLERAERLLPELSSKTGVTSDLRRLLLDCIKVTRSLVEHDAAVIPVVDDVPAVVGSEAVLSAVFVDLLVSAARAVVEQSGGERIIRVFVRKGDDEFVVVEIADSGPGIPREVAEPPFERASSTPYFCREALALLGGRLEVQSASGIGTRATVHLPRALQRHETIATAGTRPVPFSPSAPPVRKLSALVRSSPRR